MTDLKPCPFCGCKVEIESQICGIDGDLTPRSEYCIYCFKCDIKFEGIMFIKSEQEMINLWNTRAKE